MTSKHGRRDPLTTVSTDANTDQSCPLTLAAVTHWDAGCFSLIKSFSVEFAF